MLTLAANVSNAAFAAFGKLVESPLLAAPALEEEFVTAGSSAPQTAIWSDPVIVALTVAATLCLISWRLSMRKGPD